MARPGGRTRIDVRVVDDGLVRRRTDAVATEEPLEIRIDAGGRTIPIAVTMRTPGADFELAAGFLFGEGVIAGMDDVLSVGYCLDRPLAPEQRFNVVTVLLRPGLDVDLARMERHFLASSACGVCGKASLDQLDQRGLRPPPPGPTVAPDVFYALPEVLRAGQGLFDATGGLHAAGLFDASGRLVALREDVGRHNAVDKIVGWAVLNRQLPLCDPIVLVSGRVSYEIMQKCLAAGVPIVCAVSAPSSLAVDMARQFGMTLVGFLRGRRMNVYAGMERIACGPG